MQIQSLANLVFHALLLVAALVETASQPTAQAIKQASRCNQQTNRQKVPSDTSEPKKLGWASLMVSPTSVLSVPYKSQFRIFVYKSIRSPIQYFYSPLLLFKKDAANVTCTYSDFGDRYETTFSVTMWDEELERLIRDQIMEKLDKSITEFDVRVLPIEEIRFSFTGKSSGYEVYDKWVSYASQPSLFKFRFLSLETSSCQKLKRLFADSPEDILDNLLVYYSLETQKSAKKSLEVRAETLKNGKMATSLLQQLSGKNPVFMTSTDAKKMTMEMATNIMAMDVEDEEFVSTDQTLQISTLVESILKMVPESSAQFDAEMWNSVFWNEDNARPDKITSELNDNFSKLDKETQSLIIDNANSDTGVEAGLNAKVSDFGIGFDVNAADKHKSESSVATQSRMVKENKEKVEWTGEKFVPKEMKLSRVNTGVFRSTTSIATTQVNVARTNTELASRINTVTSTVLNKWFD